MENYIVSARKYRPQTFESVVGQQALTQTLQNAIRTTLQDKDYSADPYAQRLYQKIGKID